MKEEEIHRTISIEVQTIKLNPLLKNYLNYYRDIIELTNTDKYVLKAWKVLCLLKDIYF